MNLVSIMRLQEGLFMVKSKAVILSLILLSSVFLAFFETLPIASADEPQGFWTPATGPGVIDGVNLNYSRCWTWLRSNLNYNLQYSRNGLQWYSASGLQAVFHNLSESSRKLTLIFNATYGNPTASYRITCSFPNALRDYFSIDRNRSLLTIEYVVQGYPLSLVFNYSDLLGQGLLFSWGNNSDVFWFRMQKNNLPNGRYILDPQYSITTATTTATNYPGGSKIVRSVNGSLICVYRNNTWIKLAHSFDNGVTWTVTKTVGKCATSSAYDPAIAINKSSVCHIVWKNLSSSGKSNVSYVTYNDTTNTTSSLSVKIGDNYGGAVNGLSIAVDNSDNVHVSYKQAPIGSGTRCTRYLKKTGASWSAILNLSAVNDVAVINPTRIIIDNSDNVIVLYTTEINTSSYRIQTRHKWASNSTWSKTYNITSWWKLNNNYVSGALYRNNSMVVVFQGNRTGSTLQNIRYCMVPSPMTWPYPAVQNLTSCTVAGSAQGTPTVSVDNQSTEVCHIAWSGDTVGLSTGKLRYTNSSTFGFSWTTVQNLTGATTFHKSPVMLWSWNPRISGVHTDIAKKGWCAVWANNTVLSFWKSSDLSWHVPVVNNAPGFNSEDPLNTSLVTGGAPICSVYVFDPDGDTMRVCLFENSSGAWVKQYSTDAGNDTYAFVYPGSPLIQNKKYWWKVSANDGAINSTAIYWFLTDDILPYISGMEPTNGSTGINVTPAATRPMLNVSVSEQSGSALTTRWYSNATQEFVSHPMGVGNHTGLTPLGAASNWQAVDDTVLTHDYTWYPLSSGSFYSNNLTDYVKTSAFFVWQWDTYAMQNHTTESFPIYNVTICAVMYLSTSGMPPDDEARITIRTHGTYYNTTIVPNINVFFEYTVAYPLNPFTGAAWTWAEVDALACGASLKDNTGMGACISSVYFKVNPGHTQFYYQGVYRQFGLNNSNNATLSMHNGNMTSNCSSYYWYVTVADSEGTNTSSLYHFHTYCPAGAVVYPPSERRFSSGVVLFLGSLVVAGWLLLSSRRRKKK